MLVKIVRLIEFLAKKDGSSGIASINKLLDDGVDLEKFTGDLIELLRRLLIAKINPSLGEKIGLEIGESYEIRINEIKKDLPIDRIVGILEKLLIAKKEMKNAFITQLPLEMALAELCFETSRPIIVPPTFTPPTRPTSGNSFNPPAPKAPPYVSPTSNNEPAVKSSVVNESAAVYESVVVEDGVCAVTDLASFTSRWNEVLVKVKKYNHSLSFVLGNCCPKTFSGNKVCLGFKYKFHKDRVEEGKMREVIQNTFKEVFGSTVYFDAIIDEKLEIPGINNSASAGTETGNPVAVYSAPEMENVPPPTEEPAIPAAGGDVMSNLLKTFGGKIVG
jgi:hypothetical protein